MMSAPSNIHVEIYVEKIEILRIECTFQTDKEMRVECTTPNKLILKKNIGKKFLMRYSFTTKKTSYVECPYGCISTSPDYMGH